MNEKSQLYHFVRKCNFQIAMIMLNKTSILMDEIDYDNNFIKISHVPICDLEIDNSCKSNFLWFQDIINHFSNSKYYRVDDDNTIYTETNKEHANMYIDENGFLIVLMKDKYNEYSQDWKYRVNCLFNDVVYLRLIKKNDENFFKHRVDKNKIHITRKQFYDDNYSY
jgi:hypothetical protein